MSQHKLPPKMLTDLTAALLSHGLSRYVNNPAQLSNKTVFVDFESEIPDNLNYGVPTARLIVMGVDTPDQTAMLGAILVGEPNPEMWKSLFKDKDVPDVANYLLGVFLDEDTIPMTDVCFVVNKALKDGSVELRLVSTPTCSIKPHKLQALEQMLPMLAHGVTLEGANAIWF